MRLAERLRLRIGPWPFRGVQPLGEGIARILEMTQGIGADCVPECTGTQSMMQAIGSARRGGYVSYVGVPHGVVLEGQHLFFAHVHLHGGSARCAATCPTSSTG